ncbi:hypothetical protein VA7868_00992 [Vibrio aerogenes CECT 7868]|uniref:Tetratricopeptide repeat protein n=1 Tax=Vibrio aerogenes CECT 7868 TaxID=1216006 RepID=A0A1M5X5M8_9VIBR|nr:hypothetical protein [Vibrio aerogenes]SHH95150.1 hypothetical protein VA7868_00992 [Vibrio aerogenes CECT 7868]
MKFFRCFFIFLMAFLVNACANFSAENLFSDYATRNSELHQRIKQGDYSHVLDMLDSDSATDDILTPMEKGRIALLNRDYQKSLLFFDQSNKAIERQQELATISLSRETANLGSLFVNDNINDYIPADYEVGFLHLYSALSYVHENELQDALVELRRANQVQEQAKKTREDVLEREEEQLKNQGIQPDIGSILSGYPDAGKGLQAVQNGYLFYLSALLYEASGALNDAYVDYRRALAVAPDNHAVIQGTMRCAEKLGMKDDLSLLRKRYGNLSLALSSNHSRVIIIQEQGIVDMLRGWQQSVPVFHDNNRHYGLYSLALPYYQSYNRLQVMPVNLNRKAIYGALLADTNLMARYQLKEQLPSVILRQILRLAAKNSLRHGLSHRNSDGVVNLMMNVWNVATEQPDTRSWITLPGSVFSATEVVESGKQQIIAGHRTYTFDAPEKETVLVWLSRQGNNTVIWHKVLGKL